jgi:hypothetical protein
MLGVIGTLRATVSYLQLAQLCEDAWTWSYRPQVGDIVVDAGDGAGWRGMFVLSAAISRE